jgi:hypothetical protein
VEDVEAEVEKAPRDQLAVDEHVLLGKVPPARSDHEDGRVLPEFVALLTRVEHDRSPVRVQEVDLAVDVVLPRR